MRTITDILRWLIAFIIIHIIISFSLTGIFYAIEFIFRITKNLSPFIYVMILPPVLIFLWWLTSMILLPINRGVILLLVRQTRVFSLVIRIAISLGIIIFLLLFWKGFIQFGWQNLRYSKLNFILFSLFIAALLYLPWILHNSFRSDFSNPRFQRPNKPLPKDQQDILIPEVDIKVKNDTTKIFPEEVVKQVISNDISYLQEKITIDPTKTTPSVMLDTEGFIRINGRSIPENPTLFYYPIEDWVTKYICNPAPVTCIDINLEIMNADTNKHLVHIIQKITYVRIKQKKFIINWYYEDNDLFEIGENIASVLDVPINFVKLT